MSKRAKVSLIVFFFSLCGTAALVMHYRQESARNVPPSELYALIYAQVQAMQADEYSKAYQRASSNLQQRFNVEQFTAMVRAEYGDAIRAENIEFGAVEVSGNRAAIQVYFVERTGHVLPCIYFVVFEDGGWKIDGARMLRRWPLGSRLGGLRA